MSRSFYQCLVRVQSVHKGHFRCLVNLRHSESVDELCLLIMFEVEPEPEPEPGMCLNCVRRGVDVFDLR
jgi:hypothetical protein